MSVWDKPTYRQPHVSELSDCPHASEISVCDKPTYKKRATSINAGFLPFHVFFLGNSAIAATIEETGILVLQRLHMSSGSLQRIDWEAALEQHRPWLRKVLRCRVGDQHEVDDLLQEIALAVIRQSNREAPAVPTEPQRVAPWLYRLAVRQSINFHRRTGRKSAAKPMAHLDSFDENAEPLDWMLAQEERNTTQQAMQQLRSQDREILLLKYTENWSYRELANHMGVKERTIEYRLMRARQNLRNLLSTPMFMDDRQRIKDEGQVVTERQG